ncbi:MAG: alpha/beta hydrolase [Alphaproteobacteria bacterium]|nr:alpha/beta hydrolase [Alphaproteobacteria bacterium]
MRLWIAAMLALIASACSPLALFNTVAPKDSLTTPATRAIAYGDGPRQKLDIYPAAPEAKKPVIVFLYGGAWNNGRRQDYGWAARALAAKGFVVVVPDYRLAPADPFPAFVDDATAATAWAHANARRFGGDPDRIVLMGHSAGAHIAMMVALDRRFLDRAGVPSSTIRGVIGLAGPYKFDPNEEGVLRDAFGRFPEPDATQPVTFVRADAPPALLLHGDADTRVRLRNSERLDRELRAASASAELKVYPGVDHTGILLALSKPLRGRAPTLEDATAFATKVTR